MAVRSPQISVIGASDPDPATITLAEKVGELIAGANAALICGGLGGVMEAACRGAKSAGGRTVGIIPGDDPAAANRFVDIVIPSGLGEARNTLVVRAADAVIALPGKYGTLSEIAFALVAGKPLVSLLSWEITEDIVRASTPEEAVRAALDLLGPLDG